jgi:hypothetical protein
MSDPAHDLDSPADLQRAVGEVSMRLLAGAVPRATLDQLRRTLEQSPAEYPWRVATNVILAEPVDAQRVVQQALAAQRDWILRGGRERPKPGIAHRTKGLVARLVAQLVFGIVFAVVLIAGLLLLKHKVPECDIYRLLDGVRGLFG